MKRGIRILVAIALAAALGGPMVLAQAQDDFLQRYELALENLQASVAALPDTGSTAREELDRAVNALRTLARGTESATLISAMERIFERAREAIANQSPVDLAVQVEVLRGGFQRLVYDAALQSAIEGDLDTARARLLAVAADVGVPDATLETLGATERGVAELRYALEAGVAATVRQRVETARDQAATNVDAAYRTLADAYGDYLLVQDSPRIPGEVNARFVDAANALVDTQIGAFAEAADALAQRFTALEQAAVGALETSPEPAAPDAEASEPAELPSTLAVQPGASDDEALEPADEPAVEPAAEEPALGPDAEQAPEGEAGADAETPTPEEIAARIVAEREAQERQLQLDALATELTAAGVVEARREALAAQVLDGGYTSLDAVVRDLYADTAEASDALERGRPETARGFVRAFGERYRRFLAPVVATAAPETDLQTTALVSTLATVDGLRLQDVAVLSSQAGTLRGILAGAGSTMAHDAAVDTLRFWAGFVRAVVVIVLGVLAFVPLYLLNLAFGGGNRNWRLVGVALFLLLLPAIYEAAAFLADLIADLTGIDALYAVAQYSLLHSPISQVVWAALTALAIFFAIGGLYGICVQFGLIGRRRGAPAAATEVRDTVDWDEEF